MRTKFMRRSILKLVSVVAGVISACKPEPDRLEIPDYEKTKTMVASTINLEQAHALAASPRYQVTLEEYIKWILETFKENTTPEDVYVLLIARSIRSNQNDTDGLNNSALQIAQISDAFDWVAKNIKNADLVLERGIIPTRPSETLKKRFGVCRSKSFLLASILEAEGYSTEYLLGQGHVALRVFIPALEGLEVWKHMQGVNEYIGNRYDARSLNTTMTDKGIWLFLDPTLAAIPGKEGSTADFPLAVDVKEMKITVPWNGELLAHMEETISSG